MCCDLQVLERAQAMCCDLQVLERAQVMCCDLQALERAQVLCRDLQILERAQVMCCDLHVLERAQVMCRDLQVLERTQVLCCSLQVLERTKVKCSVLQVLERAQVLCCDLRPAGTREGPGDVLCAAASLSCDPQPHSHVNLRGLQNWTQYPESTSAPQARPPELDTIPRIHLSAADEASRTGHNTQNPPPQHRRRDLQNWTQYPESTSAPQARPPELDTIPRIHLSAADEASRTGHNTQNPPQRRRRGLQNWTQYPESTTSAPQARPPELDTIPTIHLSTADEASRTGHNTQTPPPQHHRRGLQNWTQYPESTSAPQARSLELDTIPRIHHLSTAGEASRTGHNTHNPPQHRRRGLQNWTQYPDSTTSAPQAGPPELDTIPRIHLSTAGEVSRTGHNTQNPPQHRRRVLQNWTQYPESTTSALQARPPELDTVPRIHHLSTAGEASRTGHNTQNPPQHRRRGLQN
ncbi:hypothetical protein NDU88_009068 [Pleurodeles waltl]|uniref:Galaxin-like repeats domain-containing protein n=1 Tax=Pleurodeles waltl TaxID=8319 RepID=A0AAV7NY00_PLEWA|nr:hypothetical protein NDU88_009068 [Pleurodeles waltl]